LEILIRFLSKKTDSFKRPHFWIAILLIGIITFIYYEIRFHPSTTFNLIPPILSLAIWESGHNIIGSLFFIVFLFSIIYLGWKGELLVWLLSIFLILPILMHFYKLSGIFVNLLFLSIPMLIFQYINIELKWRYSERRIYEEKERIHQNYLSQIFKAQEIERARIAQEIHDDSIQRLAVLIGELQLIIGTEGVQNFASIKERIEYVSNMAIEVTEDLRRITLDLRPTVLDDLGLLPSLRWLVDNFEQTSNINTQMGIVGEVGHVSTKVSTHIFRIVQEALNNVKRHSGATNVILKLHFLDSTLKIIVEDNGKGFLLPKKKSEFSLKGKMGIAGMVQRAQIINGKIHFQSEIGKRTSITVEVPIENLPGSVQSGFVAES
jgi:signal transduction histidine kinase